MISATVLIFSVVHYNLQYDQPQGLVYQIIKTRKQIVIE